MIAADNNSKAESVRGPAAPGARRAAVWMNVNPCRCKFRMTAVNGSHSRSQTYEPPRSGSLPIERMPQCARISSTVVTSQIASVCGRLPALGRIEAKVYAAPNRHDSRFPHPSCTLCSVVWTTAAWRFLTPRWPSQKRLVAIRAKSSRFFEPR